MQTSDYLEQLQQDREDLVDNLETKGITGLTGDETFTELVPEVLNIPSGGGERTEAPYKDVNFYDYDGTRVYSYTKTEFLALESMPENPEHSGLTAQGWNWTLQQAQTYVTTYGIVDIGQQYVTSDGKTRIYIELPIATTLALGFSVNGTAIVNWGDGTSETVTGTSTSALISTTHSYSDGGTYVISISSQQNLYFNGTNVGTSGAKSNILNENYGRYIIKIEFGSNVYISGALINLYNLESVVLSKGIHVVGNQFAFYKTTVPCLVYPSEVGITTYNFQESTMRRIIMPYMSSINNNGVFKNCSKLKEFVWSGTYSDVSSEIFSGCSDLTRLIVPTGITGSIYNNVFNGCSKMEYYDFSHYTNVPGLYNTNVFTGIPASCKIIVPDDLYKTWITANKWSTYANYIISKSDWDALQ